VAGDLARFNGNSRTHTESDLRAYLLWCEDQRLDPLTTSRAHPELACVGCRRVRPSTVSRRLSAVGGFYRTCAIDGILDHSPTDYVRRPPVPQESPTFGLIQLYATGASINDFGEEHGHRVLRVHGKGDKVVLVPLPPAVARAIDTAADGRGTGPSCVPAVAPGWTATPPHAETNPGGNASVSGGAGFAGRCSSALQDVVDNRSGRFREAGCGTVAAACMKEN
jgi:hypothetical protein